jgi:F420-non-reducing hydrogenase iron-sulfur subunit
MLRDLGIEPERLRLQWISAPEGDRVQTVCNEMTEQVRAPGPLRLTTPPRVHPAAPLAERAELVGQVTS